MCIYIYLCLVDVFEHLWSWIPENVLHAQTHRCLAHLLPSISQLVPWAPSNCDLSLKGKCPSCCRLALASAKGLSWSSKPRMECYMVGLLGSLHHCGGPVCQGFSNLGMASIGRKACPCPKICEDISKCKCICILYKVITSNCCNSYVCHLSQSPPGKSHCWVVLAFLLKFFKYYDTMTFCCPKLQLVSEPPDLQMSMWSNWRMLTRKAKRLSWKVAWTICSRLFPIVFWKIWRWQS